MRLIRPALRSTAPKPSASRATLDHTRYVELARDAWAPRQRLETAAADAQKADASVAAAKATLASAQQQIEVLSAQRKEAGAKLGQAKATLDQGVGRSRQDRGQGADRRRDPQGQCAAR